MEKIIQMTQYEYDRIADLAKINEDEINNRAEKLWKERGAATINIKVDTGTDYDNNYSIDCTAYLFYKDDRFQIPYELRRRFEKIIDENIMRDIEGRFGGLEKAITAFKKKQESLDHSKYYLWGLVTTGWAAFAACIFLS